MGSPTEEDYNIRSRCSSLDKQRSPPADTPSPRHPRQLPPCYPVQVRPASLSAKKRKSANIHLECLRSSLKKPSTPGGRKDASGAHIYTSSLHRHKLPRKKDRENIHAGCVKIQQIQFPSPNVNQQMWSAVITGSLAHRYAPRLPWAPSLLCRESQETEPISLRRRGAGGELGSGETRAYTHG